MFSHWNSNKIKSEFEHVSWTKHHAMYDTMINLKMSMLDQWIQDLQAKQTKRLILKETPDALKRPSNYRSSFKFFVRLQQCIKFSFNVAFIIPRDFEALCD